MRAAGVRAGVRAGGSDAARGWVKLRTAPDEPARAGWLGRGGPAGQGGVKDGAVRTLSFVRADQVRKGAKIMFSGYGSAHYSVMIRNASGFSLLGIGWTIMIK